MNLAPPANYILGVGDAMQVVIYGIQEYVANCKVNREGKIRLPIAGELNVGGLTFEAAKKLIRRSLIRVYSTLGSGQSNMSINITSDTNN